MARMRAAERSGELDPQSAAILSIGELFGSPSFIAGNLPLSFGGRRLLNANRCFPDGCCRWLPIHGGGVGACIDIDRCNCFPCFASDGAPCCTDLGACGPYPFRRTSARLVGSTLSWPANASCRVRFPTGVCRYASGIQSWVLAFPSTCGIAAEHCGVFFVELGWNWTAQHYGKYASLRPMTTPYRRPNEVVNLTRSRWRLAVFVC
jgi:hypothetical protein